MTIVEFLQDAGLTITKYYGDEVVAYCPWHDDRNASLAINVNGKGWHCFIGWGKGRNINSLLDKLQPKVNLYQRFLDLFPELYIKNLNFDQPKEEKPDPYQDIKGLPSAVGHDYLQIRNITDDTAAKFDLRYHAQFNSIIIPIYQSQTLVGTVQRRIDGNPKYMNSRGMDKDRILFPFDLFQPKEGKIILVEGLFDAIKAHQSGITNTLSTFGGNVSDTQVKMLGSLARTVIICPDKDSSGIKMAYKTTDMLLKMGLRVEYTFAPGMAKDFGDVDDFTNLEYHSYWKLKILKRNLNQIMERSNA